MQLETQNQADTLASHDPTIAIQQNETTNAERVCRIDLDQGHLLIEPYSKTFYKDEPSRASPLFQNNITFNKMKRWSPRLQNREPYREALRTFFL